MLDAENQQSCNIREMYSRQKKCPVCEGNTELWNSGMESNKGIARDRKRKLLNKIEEALVRIESGEYGYCEDTGEPIGIARLKARPIATLCIEAQERHEKYERQHQDEDQFQFLILVSIAH